MKNLTKAAWGVFFVLLGAALACKALGLVYFNIYFPGWWTLFIIIPSLIGLLERGNRAASLFGLGIGFLLLLTAQGILSLRESPRLVLAIAFIALGVSFLFREEKRGHNLGGDSYKKEKGEGSYDDTSGYREDKSSYTESENYKGADYNSTNYRSTGQGSSSHGSYQHYYSFLGSRTVQIIEEIFKGATVTSMLGNVQLDIRNAYLDNDVVIDTTCILGGIDIYVPRNVKVVVNCTPILGGVDSGTIMPGNITADTHTIFIRGTCILGGVVVK